MFASIFLIWICFVFLVLLLKARRPKNFPPGPPILPILGNILHLRLENPLKDFERLRKSYGNVYSLFLGTRPAVIINGMKAIKEALVTKGTDFAGRPQDVFINDAVQRKGNTLNPQVLFHNAASNIICQVLFGTRYKYDDEFIKVIVQCFTEITKITNGPWAMRGDDGSNFSEERLIMYTLDLHLAGTDTTSNTLLTGFLYLMNYPHIQGHLKPGEACVVVVSSTPYTDTMAALNDKSGQSHQFKKIATGMYSSDIHRERCQQEIDKVLEGKDQASFDDRHNMPYMQAVIHEVQRIANTVPLSVPHCTTKDTELMGYSIPRGQWKSPNEFNPENFLNDQGEFVKPEAFVPFSAGPRMCLGEGLARMELFLIMVTLLRKFKFIWPEDAGEPDYTPVYGITLTPKPYRMEIQLRATHHGIIHLQGFGAKKMPEELRAAPGKSVKIVNLIKSHALKACLFPILCDEIGTHFRQLLLHSEVYRLSRGKVLHALCDLREEVLLFNPEFNSPLGKHMEDMNWVSRLAYLFERIHVLNNSRQGEECIVFLGPAVVAEIQRVSPGGKTPFPPDTGGFPGRTFLRGSRRIRPAAH
ncbi:hypothetical protein FQN60_014449 [Etheostoma spectabile]|uniref:Cytochrome P450 n=1 Tax=Etheostoma spectabile TaxID=54343 RepID=A0A5J5DCD6_9PERO|nr:hypothetical protein FQN60_014449 [Etheostoma spectabile]